MTVKAGRPARFIFAGVLNTAFGWLVYSVAILFGAPVWSALIAGILFGIVFNFFTIGGYAFKALSISRLPRFIAVYVIIYIINLLSINYLVNVLLEAIWAQAVLTLPMAFLSYALMRAWVFADSP
jgi:putative flippase GtrA